MIYRMYNLRSLTLSDLLTVSKFEQQLMLWLKNCEKKYKSQALNMSINDQFIDAKASFGRSIKNRRDSQNKVVLSPSSPSDSLVYNATCAYINNLEKAQSRLPDNEKNKLFPNIHPKWNIFVHNASYGSNFTSKILSLLNRYNSHLVKLIKSELDAEYTKPFFWLLDNAIKNNKEIPSSAIRNSVIAMEDRLKMSSYTDQHRQEMDAESSGHNLMTRKNHYTSNSKSREVAGSVKAMEQRTIELMQEDANAILQVFEDKIKGGLRIIQNQELDELREQQKYKNIKHSHSKLYEVFGAEGNENGFYQKNGQNIFIESPLTVAFMLTQIHLKNNQVEQNRINLKHKLNELLLIDILVMKYVMEKKFSSEIVKEGLDFFEIHIKPTLESKV